MMNKEKTDEELKKEARVQNYINFGMRTAVSSALHPFEYAKVLIQIGYEPIAPRPGKTIFGNPTMVLPNIFQYVKHIKSVDGLAGCYNGLIPKIWAQIASTIAVYQIEKRYFEKSEESHEIPSELRRYQINEQIDLEKVTITKHIPEEETWKDLYVELRRDVALHITAVIASQPFQVISVRMMAQFIGRETIYNSMWSSIKEIWSTEGIRGFFAGIKPRLISDLSILILTSTSCFLIRSHLLKEGEKPGYLSGFISFCYTSLMYPLQVVSTCLSVCGSRLKAGSEPFMPYHERWSDFYDYLVSINQHKRGSSLFWRHYRPQVPNATFVPYPKLSKH